MDYFNKEQSELFRMEIDPIAKSDFLEMTRWTKFMAVVGFVAIGLLLLFGVFMAVFLSAFTENYGGPSAQVLSTLGGFGILLIFLIFIGIYFYPVYALFKYSTSMKKALTTDSREQFNRAIAYLKNMFKYMGIMMIIGLCLWGLQIVLAIILTLGK